MIISGGSNQTAIDRELQKTGLRLVSPEPERKSQHDSKWDNYTLCTSQCDTVRNAQHHV